MLYLHNNPLLTGTIPQDWVLPTALADFELANCNFSGPLPTRLKLPSGIQVQATPEGSISLSLALLPTLARNPWTQSPYAGPPSPLCCALEGVLLPAPQQHSRITFGLTAKPAVLCCPAVAAVLQQLPHRHHPRGLGAPRLVASAESGPEQARGDHTRRAEAQQRAAGEAQRHAALHYATVVVVL